MLDRIGRDSRYVKPSFALVQTAECTVLSLEIHRWRFHAMNGYHDVTGMGRNKVASMLQWGHGTLIQAVLEQCLQLRCSCLAQFLAWV